MFFKGMSFGFMAKNGYYSSAEGKAEIQRLIATGADSVSLMVTFMQNTFASTRVYRDFILTPSDDEVRETIRTIRQFSPPAETGTVGAHDHGGELALDQVMP